MEIRSLRTTGDFLELINDSRLNISSNYYRGQADFLWDITPSIVRNQSLKDVDLLLKVENKLIERFEQKFTENNLEFLIPNIGNYDRSWIILMAAQHYGLPTRLLDFSNDKIISLLFAVTDIQYLNKDGAIIIYNNPVENQTDLKIFENGFVNNLTKSFFIPAPILIGKQKNELRLSEIRKFLQGSKFLYRDNQNWRNCLSLDGEHSKHLTKIHIPKELKLQIIKEIIRKEAMVYDLFVGKNELDHYAAILKLQFEKLNYSNLSEFI